MLSNILKSFIRMYSLCIFAKWGKGSSPIPKKTGFLAFTSNCIAVKANKE